MRKKNRRHNEPVATVAADSSNGGEAETLTPLRALHVLATNRKITSSPLRVLLFVWPELDPVVFRPIKQAWVAKHLHISQQAVSLILQTLVAEGFLEPGDPEGTARTYRLNADHELIREIYADPLYKQSA